MIKLSKNLKQIFYGLLMTLCTYMLIDTDRRDPTKYYVIVSFLTAAAFLFSVYATWLSSKTRLKQLGLPVVNETSNMIIFIYHFILPFLFLFSLILFIYFNKLSLWFLPFAFVLFFVIFVNLRAFAEDKFKLEASTHFIHFFSILFAVFALIDAAFNLTRLYDLNIFFVTFIIFCVVGLLLIILLIDNMDLNPQLAFYIIISSLVITCVSILLYHRYGSPIRNSFLVTNLFYFVSALNHHKVEGTLSYSVVFEYSLIAILSFVLLYGI